MICWFVVVCERRKSIHRLRPAVPHLSLSLSSDFGDLIEFREREDLMFWVWFLKVKGRSKEGKGEATEDRKEG